MSRFWLLDSQTSQKAAVVDFSKILLHRPFYVWKKSSKTQAFGFGFISICKNSFQGQRKSKFDTFTLLPIQPIYLYYHTFHDSFYQTR